MRPARVLAVFALAGLAPPAARAAEIVSSPAIQAPEIRSVPSPEARAPSRPSLARGADGLVWLAWIEGSAADRFSLRCAPLIAPGGAWGPALTIAPGAEADAQSSIVLASQDTRRLAAAWSAGPPQHRRVLSSESSDGGATWSVPCVLSSPSGNSGGPSLIALARGAFLATWVEHPNASDRSAPLHARQFGHGEPGPDAVIDGRGVPSGLSPGLAAFSDGGALAAVPADLPGGVFLARLRGDSWSAAGALGGGLAPSSNLQADAPVLAVDGGRVAVAWTTREGSRGVIHASSSPDAGERFLLAQTIGTSAVGSAAPSIALLHDGALLVFWNGAAAGGEGSQDLCMRRVTPDAALDPIIHLPAAVGGAPVSAALLRDYSGGTDSASVVVAASTQDGGAVRLRTWIITIPESSLLAAADDICHCAPTTAELMGFPIRGTIIATSSGPASLSLRHGELPGLMAAGTDTFRTAPELAASAPKDARCLARIARRGADWWIFDVRLLGTPIR